MIGFSSQIFVRVVQKNDTTQCPNNATLVSWLRRLNVVLSENLVPFLHRKNSALPGLLETILILLCDEGKITKDTHMMLGNIW